METQSHQVRFCLYSHLLRAMEGWGDAERANCEKWSIGCYEENGCCESEVLGEELFGYMKNNFCNN